MRKALLLAVFPALPALAHAGTAYDMTSRLLTQATPQIVTNHYFAEDGKVRFATPDGKVIVIAKDRTIYTLDTTAHTVQTLNVTLAQMNANLNASSQRLRDAFASDPPERRNTMNQLSETMERQQKPQPSDYVLTGSSESVGGRTCHIWERSENGIRRSIESLGGVPLLIREYDPNGTAVRYEVTFTGIHVEPKNPSLFEIPEGYEQKGSLLAPHAATPGTAPAASVAPVVSPSAPAPAPTR